MFNTLEHDQSILVFSFSPLFLMTTTQTESMSNFTTQKRTISWIVVDKLLENISNASLTSILYGTNLFLGSLLLTFTFIYPETIKNAIIYLFWWNNFAFPKLIVSFMTIFNFRRIVDQVKKIIPTMLMTKENDEDCDTIEWIPVHELLDHLFENKSFKREDVEKKFSIPRYKFTELANRFEELWILTRWMNNSRILNPDFWRQDIARMLQWIETVEEIKQVFRKESQSSFTMQPIWKIIKDKRNDVFTNKATAPHWFTTQKIWNSLQTSSEDVRSDMQE